MGSYVPHRNFINVEGQDTTPIRLKDNRLAWLTLPKDFREEDVELIVRHLRFNAELGKDALRPEGPPEPHERAKGWY